MYSLFSNCVHLLSFFRDTANITCSVNSNNMNWRTPHECVTTGTAPTSKQKCKRLDFQHAKKKIPKDEVSPYQHRLHRDHALSPGPQLDVKVRCVQLLVISWASTLSHTYLRLLRLQPELQPAHSAEKRRREVWVRQSIHFLIANCHLKCNLS